MGAAASVSINQVENLVKDYLSQETITRLKNNANLRVSQLNKIKITTYGTSVTLKNITQANYFVAYVLYDDVIKELQKANAPITVENQIRDIQEAKAGIGFAASLNRTNIQTVMSRYVSQKTLNDIDRNCKSTAAQYNVIDITQTNPQGVINLDGISQVNETYNKCAMSAMISLAKDIQLPTSIINDLEKQATAKGLTLGDFLGTWGFLIIGIVVLVLIYFGYKFMTSEQGKELTSAAAAQISGKGYGYEYGYGY